MYTLLLIPKNMNKYMELAINEAEKGVQKKKEDLSEQSLLKILKSYLQHIIQSLKIMILHVMQR